MKFDSTPTLGGWLVHVLREADGALSLEEALHAIMDSMGTYFPCQSVAVILVHEDSKEMAIKISRRISYTFAKQFHRNEPGPAIEKLILEHEPLLVQGAAPGSDLYAELKLEHDFSSAALAPIIQNHRGIGYIFCDRAADGASPPFTESDLLHLQVMGLLIGSLMQKFELLHIRKQLSPIDDASGAAKYTAFVADFATEIQRAISHDYPVVLAILDVGGYSKTMQTYGMDRAHGLLAEVVTLARPHLRDVDMIARYSADQFILCLSGLPEPEARSRLDAMLGEINAKAGADTRAGAEVRAGAVILAAERHKTRQIQDLIAAAGHMLVEAQNGARREVVAAPLPD